MNENAFAKAVVLVNVAMKMDKYLNEDVCYEVSCQFGGISPERPTEMKSAAHESYSLFSMHVRKNILNCLITV